MKNKLALLARLQQSNAVRAGLAVGIAAMATNAHAAAGDIDVTLVVAAIVAAGVAITTVGGAKVVMVVGGKAWGWIQRFI